MNLHQIREHLLPAAERDPKFRDYVRRSGLSGLRTLVLVEAAVPVLVLAGRMAVTGDAYNVLGRGGEIWQSAGVVVVALLTFLASRFAWIQNHARLAAAISVVLAPAALFGIALWKPVGSMGADDYVMAGITAIVMTATVAVPFRPWHMLVTGLTIQAMYFLSSSLAVRSGFDALSTFPPSSTLPANGDAHTIFLLMLTLLAMGIAAANYRHSRGEFEANQQAVRVAEALSGAQARAQLAENAISIGKLAAALSHEINSPLGALRSSIDTLIKVTDRQIAGGAEHRTSLMEMRGHLTESIQESAARIEEVTKRLRQFVSLEEAELKPADLNDLLTTVTVLHEDELREGKVRLDLDLEKTLPPLTCRPQLLTAAFSSLLSNAIHAVNGDGRIGILTRKNGREIEVTIRDNGRGMAPEHVDTIFEPSFKVSGSRVSSGNWSLFNARQIVYEHGGEIRVETAEGQGTAVHVMLPVA